MSYLTPDLFRGIIKRFINECYMQDELTKYICILIHEQGQNETLRSVFRKWLCNEPLELLKEMFMSLIEIGFIRRTSVSLLAEAFYYPLSAIFLQYQTIPQPHDFETAYLEYVDRFIKEFKA